MGTDIHVYAEEKYGDRWLPVFETELRVWRHYDLFRRLAGVRDDGFIRPISEPRGLPADVSRWVKLHIHDCADHSFSWLNDSELLGSQEEWPSDFYYLIRYIDSSCERLWRLVFGFDN
jgi:hypothetical protein